MLNENTFDGFKIVFCPKCKMNQKVFFKKGDKNTYCPLCYTKINTDDVIKTINKKVEGLVNFTE